MEQKSAAPQGCVRVPLQPARGGPGSGPHLGMLDWRGEASAACVCLSRSTWDTAALRLGSLMLQSAVSAGPEMEAVVFGGNPGLYYRNTITQG